MANIALITTVSDVYVRGPRKIAQFLNAHGHKTTLIYLPLEVSSTGLGPNCVAQIPAPVVQQVLELIESCEIVGYSAMTDYIPMVRQLAMAVEAKYPKRFQILGGVHAIQAPEWAIREPLIQAICTGEGELPFLDLANRWQKGLPLETTRGFWFKGPRGVIQNAPGDYVDLDTLPFVDLSLGYIGIGEKVEPIREEHLKAFFGTTYWTDRSRGCPFKCSYCIHSKLAEEKNNPVRWNSMKYFVAETKAVLDRYPFFNSLYFNDETFTVQSIDQIKEFSEIYRRTIDLPFSTYVDPFSATPEKLDHLFRAGLTKLKMGVQSGSKRIMTELFDRNPNFDKIVELTEFIGKKWGGKMSLPIYDFITGIPWATDSDKEDAFRTIAKFHPPFFAQVFTLAHYPGSKLFRMAVKDKIVDPMNLPQQNHAVTEPTLSNALLQLLGFVKFPSWLIEMIIQKGWAKSAYPMPRLFRFSTFFGNARKLVAQIRFEHPTLMRYSLVRACEILGRPFGFFQVRDRYDTCRKVRDEFTHGAKSPECQPGWLESQAKVLIAMEGRSQTLGQFVSGEKKADRNVA